MNFYIMLSTLFKAFLIKKKSYLIEINLYIWYLNKLKK